MITIIMITMTMMYYIKLYQTSFIFYFYLPLKDDGGNELTPLLARFTAAYNFNNINNRLIVFDDDRSDMKYWQTRIN